MYIKKETVLHKFEVPFLFLSIIYFLVVLKYFKLIFKELFFITSFPHSCNFEINNVELLIYVPNSVIDE